MQWPPGVLHHCSPCPPQNKALLMRANYKGSENGRGSLMAGVGAGMGRAPSLSSRAHPFTREQARTGRCPQKHPSWRSVLGLQVGLLSPSSPPPATIKTAISDGQASWQSSPAIPDLGLKADLGEKLQGTPKPLEKGSGLRIAMRHPCVWLAFLSVVRGPT